MGWFKKAIVGAAMLGAVEGGMSKEAAAAKDNGGQSNKEHATLIDSEPKQSPEMQAKQDVIDKLNDTTFDDTSGAIIPLEHGSAVVTREKDGGLVAKVTLGEGAEAVTREFVIQEDEKTDAQSNNRTVYSMKTGVDRRQETEVANARAAVDQAGGKGSRLASNK